MKILFNRQILFVGGMTEYVLFKVFLQKN